ncbi:hypothetical protein DFJ73DRAFT_89769 [Zopfochytrium polystomum]|nr:hypothetical protein DFJ73DRAFT_89769 [Zopfochytrium polystomum]
MTKVNQHQSTEEGPFRSKSRKPQQRTEPWLAQWLVGRRRAGVPQSERARTKLALTLFRCAFLELSANHPLPSHGVKVTHRKPAKAKHPTGLSHDRQHHLQQHRRRHPPDPRSHRNRRHNRPPPLGHCPLRPRRRPLRADARRVRPRAGRRRKVPRGPSCAGPRRARRARAGVGARRGDAAGGRQARGRDQEDGARCGGARGQDGWGRCRAWGCRDRRGCREGRRGGQRRGGEGDRGGRRCRKERADCGWRHDREQSFCGRPLG